MIRIIVLSALFVLFFTMYDQYAFSEEISSIGIFDFENNDQIVYQISNGEIISMNPNIVENNIQIGVYGIAPTIIDLHIPNDVLNSDNFFSYIIDNDSKFFLDTTTTYYESLAINHIKIKLSAPSWHDGTQNEQFLVTLVGDDISSELHNTGKKISSDSTILKKFYDDELGISFFYPEDMNPYVDIDGINFQVSQGGYNFFINHSHEKSEGGINSRLFMGENGYDIALKVLPEICVPECTIAQLHVEETIIGKLPSTTFYYEFDFIEESPEENYLNKIGMLSLSKIGDEYIRINVLFNEDAYYDAISRNAVILNSLDVEKFIDKQISKDVSLKQEIISDTNRGIEFSKPMGWKQVTAPKDPFIFLEFEIKDYYATDFPYVTISHFTDPSLYEINDLDSAEKYFSNFLLINDDYISEITDVDISSGGLVKYISNISKTFDKDTGLLLFAEKSVLMLYPDGQILELNLGADADSFLRVIDEFDHMVTTIECCDVKEDNSVTNDVASKEIQNKTDGGGCLIATAAFGSEMAPQVQFLREIRDNTVMKTQSGTAFMTGFNQFYYSFSPAIADYERENPVFKEAVKVTLTPLLTSLTLLNYVDIDTEEEILGYGIGIILLNIGMYFVAPAVLIVSLKKRLFI